MDYFAIRHDETPDGLIRQDGSRFESLHMDGHWLEHESLIDKVKEWNVEPVDEKPRETNR